MVEDGILEGKDRLDEWSGTGRAFERGDDLVEGDILVGKGFEELLLELINKPSAGGVIGESGADDEEVYEEADERFEFGAGAPGGDGADEDFGLLAVSREQEVEGAEKNREVRDAKFAGGLLDGGAKCRRKIETFALAFELSAGGARVVEGQIEQGEVAGEFTLPEGELIDEPAIEELFAVPGRVIGILNG